MYSSASGAYIMQKCYSSGELCAGYALAALPSHDRVSYMRIVTLTAVNDSLNLVYSLEFYDNLVDEVNRALEPLSLEFRQMMSEEDGQAVCAIVSLRRVTYYTNAAYDPFSRRVP